MSLGDVYCYMIDKKIYYLNVDRETFNRLKVVTEPLIAPEDCGEFGFEYERRNITCLQAKQAYLCNGIPGVCLESTLEDGRTERLILIRYQGGNPIDPDSWEGYFSSPQQWCTVTAIDAMIEDVVRDRYQILSETEGWPNLVVGKEHAEELIGKFLRPRVFFTSSFFETSEHVVSKDSLEWLRKCARIVEGKNGSWSLSMVGTSFNEKVVRVLISHKGKWYVQTIRNKEAEDKQRRIYLWGDPYAASVCEFFESYGFRNDNDESEVDHVIPATKKNDSSVGDVIKDPAAAPSPGLESHLDNNEGKK